MSLAKKILYKFRLITTPKIIKLSLILHCPWLTARIFQYIAATVNSQGSYTVLCLGRTIFTDDVKAMTEHSGQIKYYVIHLRHWQKIYDHFVKQPQRTQITESNYHYCPEGLAPRKKYYRYLQLVLPHLRKFLKINAILSGNFTYVPQIELARVCRQANFPFIVLHKEGLTAGVYKDTHKLYAGQQFIGTRMLVYNQKILEALIGKVKNLSLDNIEPVGMPRLDSYFKIKKVKPQKQIIFFSFYPHQRFKRLVTSQQKFNQAINRAADFHKWVINFALQNPSYKIIIKTKSAEFYLDYVKHIFERNFNQPIDNLTITDSGSPPELINQSLVSLGFSSMSLLESLILNKPIISPYFGDIVTDKPWDYFGGYRTLINYVKSQSELHQLLSHPEQLAPINQQQKNKFLERFIYQPDGRACQRAERAIIKTIKLCQA